MVFKKTLWVGAGTEMRTQYLTAHRGPFRDINKGIIDIEFLDIPSTNKMYPFLFLRSISIAFDVISANDGSPASDVIVSSALSSSYFM